MTAEAGRAAETLPMSRAQRRSIALADSRVNLWSGSIRSGKTVASLLRWLIYVATAPRGGELVVIGRTRESIARNVFGPLMDTSLFGPLAHLVSYTAGAPTAKILGRTVWVLGAHDSRAEAVLRGLTVAGAYVDEATLVSEAFWTQLLGRMSVPGAQLFATTNPDAPAHWLKRTVIDRADLLGYRIFRFTLADNPFLPAAYVTQIEREFVGLWRRRFILGEWTIAEGAVYDMFDPDRHVRPARDMPVVTRLLADGIDYGTTNPTRAERLGLTAEERPRLAVVREWAPPTGLTDAEQSRLYRAWRAKAQAAGNTEPEWTVVDPAAASFKVQLRADGIPDVINGANEVVPGIRAIASLLATDRIVIADNCDELLRFLPSYSWSPEATAKGEDAPLKVDDHEVDALRYGVHTTRTLWRDAVPLTAPEDDVPLAA